MGLRIMTLQSAQEKLGTNDPAAHYDESYFLWQNDGAAIGGEANKEKFLPFLRPEHRAILDFGCGGGSLLRALPAETKIGVEINPAARAHAERIGIRAVPSLADIPDASIDAVVSNHAMEHVESPLDVMRQVHRVLKPGGIAIVVVPCDRAHYPFKRGDRDFHLFSWSASNLGNLALVAGFEVERADEIVHRWPPGWQTIRRLGGRRLFDLVCRLYGYLRRSRSQVRVVARKPTEV